MMSWAQTSTPPSALVAEAIREYLDRRAVAAARAWHACLTGEDAAAFADFNAAW
jgi:hypothetical protein